MSKIVKSVGKVISKVVKGIGKVVKAVVGSKLGKIVLAASAIYFGSAFINGAMSNTAGGWAGAFSGGMDGLANAGKSLLQAGSSVLDGNFSKAGASLSSGFSGGYTPGADAAQAVGQNIGMQQIGSTAATTSMEAAASGVAPLQTVAPPPVQAPGGFLNSVSNAAGKTVDYIGKNPTLGYGLVQMGGNMMSGMFQGKAMEEQQKREAEQEEENRRRAERNQSVGNINAGLMNHNYAGWSSSGRA